MSPFAPSASTRCGGSQANTPALRRPSLHGDANVAVHVRDGNTFLEILQAARDLHSDMIIMGTHGRTGIAHLIIGSIAEKIVRASTIPVMTVRASA